MEITQEELRQKIKNGDKLIIDFWAPWCRPCGVMKPVFEKVSEHYRNENSEVQLFTLNVEENKEFASQLGVRSIPTVKSFSEGKEVYSQPGMKMESQIKELVEDLLN